MTDVYTQWTIPFLKTLVAAGVTHAVISPGSRSTPLALSAMNEPALTHCVVVDERSAAFFALGQARKTGRPSVLICTSGSAGAHYFPAVIEASAMHLPLIIITADRPWELQQCGANQTVDQQKLFGAHVKNFFELGEPANTPGARNAMMRIAANSVHCALSPSPGPVHINARFRKPLEPASSVFKNQLSVPASRSIPSIHIAPESAVDRLVWYCQKFEQGIIVCGPGPMRGSVKDRMNALASFAAAAKYPVLAETASNLRNSSSPFMSNAAALFAGNGFESHLPEVIIELHRPLTTGDYERFIAQYPDIPRVTISEDDYVDAHSTANFVVTADIADVMRRAAAKINVHRGDNWMNGISLRDAAVSRIKDRFILTEPFCDGTVVSTVTSLLSHDAVLCLGNSLVIRDTDLFAAPVLCGTVLHQRGASGIDGLISGSAGTAFCSDAPVVLMLGDISALHDLGGFALLSLVSVPLVIVIINNHGGQIFTQLPLAQTEGMDEHLQKGFVLPGLPTFKDVCRMFDIPYYPVGDTDTLKQTVLTALTTPRATVVEADIRIAPDFRNRFFSALQTTTPEKHHPNE